MTPPAGRVILTYGRSLMALVIARSLASRGVDVIGCDDVDLTVLSFSKHVRETFVVAPWRSQPDQFLDDLERAVLDYAPDAGQPYVLMPVFEEVALISQHRARFEPVIKVAAPAYTSLSQVEPKDQLADLVARAGLAAPKTWKATDDASLQALAQEMDYPLIVKPSRGAGGRGVKRVDTAQDAIDHARDLGFARTPLLQALAPGDDYCVALLADQGQLAALHAYRNITTFPRKSGAGAIRETVSVEPFREGAAALVRATGWNGLAELDFRWTGEAQDAPLLIEVNARFWAGVHHSIQTAVDFPWLLYLHAIGAPLDDVGEPDIGSRTKTPGVWLLAALEEVAASSPRLQAAGEAWRDVKRRLAAGELSELRRQLPATLEALSMSGLGEDLKAVLAEGKDAPGELDGDDPLVGLGALFVLSNLVKHGKLPSELTFSSKDEPDDPPRTAPRSGRPVIGVTLPDRGEHLPWLALQAAIRLAGGKAVRLTTRAPYDPHSLDGLLFAGGSDVYPLAFEGRPKPGYRYDLARQDMEASWGLVARTHDLPVLGICRGAQMLNVLAGGTLHHDLSSFAGADLAPSFWSNLTVRKPVRLAPTSRLASLLDHPATLKINIVHKQAIDRLGVGLTVAARQANGVVQAIEDRSRRFWIGVQYHPELLLHHRAHRRLFRAFVEAAEVRRSERQGAERQLAAEPAARR